MVKDPDSQEITTEQDERTEKEEKKTEIEENCDPLNRAEGEALCPERFTREDLLEKKRQMGSYSFAALYQQRPQPLEGGLFKYEWFKDSIIAKPPDGLKWVRTYDLAVSTKTEADFTASVRCAFDKEGILYICDVFRKKIEYPDQRRFVLERMTEEKNTVHGIETALHGHALVQDLQRHRPAKCYPLVKIKVEADKLTRALAWSPLAEDHKVKLVEGPWINDFLDEICRFTGRGDHHDDQVDAVSMAVNLLSKKTGKTWGF